MTDGILPAPRARLVIGLAVSSGFLAGAMFEEFLIGWLAFPTLDGLTFARSHASWRHTHPFTIVPMAVVTTLGLIVLMVVERGSATTSRKLLWLATLGAVSTGVVTLGFMLSLNEQIFAWAESAVLPPDWADIRDRWSRLQGLRALFSGGAFIALLLAATKRYAGD